MAAPLPWRPGALMGREVARGPPGRYPTLMPSDSCRALAGAVAALALLPSPSLACSVCGCGDPLLVSSDPAAITGTLRLQLDSEFLSVTAGSESEPGMTDQLDQASLRLNAVYRPIDALSLSATLPWTSKTMRMLGGPAPETTSDLAGLGDVEIGARWAAWRRVDLGTGQVHELAVSAGTSLPTGANGAVDASGVRIDEHGQLGSGSWGPFAGVHYRYEVGRWVAAASVSGRVHSANGAGYTYGAALLWSVHGQYQPARWVVLDLGVDGRDARADEEDGATVGNTGGAVVSAAPGVYLNPTGGLWVFARGQVPVYRDLLGEQQVRPVVVVGLQYSLL